MQACRVVRYGELSLEGSLRVACNLPERIQLVAVGLDIFRKAQASSSVRLCDSIGYLQAKRNRLGGRLFDADAKYLPGGEGWELPR